MLQYQTGELIYSSENNINEKVNYTANMSIAAISTANTNLDGTGSISTLITAASNGTLVTDINITATGTTTRGMIRFFIGDGGGFTRIIDEVDVPAITQLSTQKAFNIAYETNWYLKAGYTLGVSTEKSEGFSVIAEGLDMSYPTLHGAY
jgi:hypothetical protein